MDYYSLLGVNRNATAEEIRKAYREKAKTHHPDRGGDPEIFKQINEAYEILSSSEKRAEYDNPRPQFEFNTGNFDDIFNVFFGNPQFVRKNRDLKISVTIELEEVLTGKNVVLNYANLAGKTNACTIRLHPGVENGEIIRFRNLGDDSIPNLAKGDLIVQIKVLKHNIFERDGKHLKLTATVNVLDLILGTKIDVTTLQGGKISVNVPAGTQSGTILSVARQGLPDKTGGPLGNLYIYIKGFTPTVVDLDTVNKLKEIKNGLSTST
jgi:DnaJ-class molecular chaperone